MPKTREQKKAEVTNLKEKLEQSKAVVFTSQEGVSVQDTQKLRSELRENNSELLTVKKTLLNLVFKEKKYDYDASWFKHSANLAFSYGDEVSAAKAVHDFSKDHEGVTIAGGILEGEVIAPEKVMALAKLPSREELLAQTVRTIQMPISGFVNVLAGTLRSFVFVLAAYKDSKQ